MPNNTPVRRPIVVTDHLFLDLADRKVKIRGNLHVTFSAEEKTVEFHNPGLIEVVMVRNGSRIYAVMYGETFLVEKYHTSYRTYPLIKAALS